MTQFTLTRLPVTPEYDRIAHPGFDEVVTTLQSALRDLGHEVLISTEPRPGVGRPIVLNWCVVNAPELAGYEPPEGAIVYNIEAFDSPWSRTWPRLAASVRTRGVQLWESREENVPRWRHEYGVQALHVPFGFSPELVNVEQQEEKPIDVLFYGSLNPRRAAVLDVMQHAGLRVHYQPYVFGASRARLMGQAKIVLSLRFAAGYQVEHLRIIPAMANGCFVVCEDGPGLEPFYTGLEACQYDELPCRCVRAAKWETPLGRAIIADRGRELARVTGDELRRALERATR